MDQKHKWITANRARRVGIWGIYAAWQGVKRGYREAKQVEGLPQYSFSHPRMIGTSVNRADPLIRSELNTLGVVFSIRPMSPNLPFYDSEWKRHRKHPLALCRRGNMHNLVRLGICTVEEYCRSMTSVKGAKARNRYWAALGYPNLARARQAKQEIARRRRLLGVKALDHSVDHLLEICAPVLSPTAPIIR